MVEVIHFLVPLMSLAFLAIGFQWKEYIGFLVGGIMLFLYGVNILINPIEGLTGSLNTIYASLCWAYGAYVFIRSSIETFDVDVGSFFGGQ